VYQGRTDAAELGIHLAAHGLDGERLGQHAVRTGFQVDLCRGVLPRFSDQQDARARPLCADQAQQFGSSGLDDRKTQQQQVRPTLLTLPVGIAKARQVMGLVLILQHKLQHSTGDLVVVDNKHSLVFHRA